MRNALRIVVGIIGLLSLMTMANLWFNTQAAAQAVGLDPQNLIGRATVRADIAGLFGGIGLLALLAAWKADRALAGWSLLIVGCALAGRLISLLIDGAMPASWPPIAVEVVTIAILLAARRVWGKVAPLNVLR